MHFIQIKDIYKNQREYAQKEIEIAGWIRTIRSSKSFGFLELNDGTFFKNMQSSDCKRYIGTNTSSKTAI